MGLTPNPPLDDGDASDVGRPPFGTALYSRLSAAREARDRSSPSRVTIADAFLPPPARRPAGGMARPPAKPTSRSALHESPRFHPPRQQAHRRARQARPRRNRRRHRPQKPHPRQSVRSPRSHRAPLLAILSRPALSSPNVAAEMDQAAALQARGKSPERTLVGS